jgi:hypothetical protein
VVFHVTGSELSRTWDDLVNNSRHGTLDGTRIAFEQRPREISKKDGQSGIKESVAGGEKMRLGGRK